MMDKLLLITNRGVSSVVNGDLIEKVNNKTGEDIRFSMLLLYDEFPKISKTVLDKIV